MPALATKLHRPQPRADLVSRSRLFERLTESEHTRLTLISAPAGFGKTTLVSQWVAELPEGQNAVWVSLDAGDNDPRRFLTHFVAALQQADDAVGIDAQQLLDASAGLVVEQILTSLVNDLDLVAEPTIVVLDDLHTVTAHDVQQALAFLLDHLPPQVRLVVTTRSDPPLPLARLRSNGGLLELRAADLRFTSDEAADLLNGTMGLRLDPQLVTSLDERTEGWAAGLQLAALSLRGTDDAAAFVEQFAGSHRFVLDYLLEEVLNRQPDEVRDFLLETSILQTMQASLCETVTGRPGVQGVLEMLDRDNTFVVPLDEQRIWYRYHHLFAEALQARLEALHPERVPQLHAAAGRWYAEHDLLADAVHHTTSSGDLDAAADLVELALPRLRRERQDDTIRRYLAALPDDVLRGRTLLATQTAWSRLAEGDLTVVEGWLDAAERALTGGGDLPADLLMSLPDAAAERRQELRQLPAMIEVYRASVAQARGDTSETGEHARTALALSGPDDHFTRGAAGGFLGLSQWAAGDVREAVETFGAAAQSLGEGGSVADQLGATVVLATMRTALGRPDQARRLYEEALTTAERLPILSTRGDLHVGLADVLREQGELVGALEHLDAARQLGDRASLPENRHRWHATMAGVLSAQGELDAALAQLAIAESVFQPGFFPDVRPLAATIARLQTRQGRLSDAAAWAASAGVSVQDTPSFLTEYEQLTLARLLIARHNVDDASALVEVIVMLDGIVESALVADRPGSVLEAQLVRALAHASGGDRALAHDDLAAALTIAARGGYCRLFLDEGTPMVELLRPLVQEGQDDDVIGYASALITAAETPVHPVGAAAPTADRGGLSERELDVLRLLATDLTGPEIARQLFISVNTLRTHTKNIFTKLDVNTRRAAVSRAVELGLL